MSTGYKLATVVLLSSIFPCIAMQTRVLQEGNRFKFFDGRSEHRVHNYDVVPVLRRMDGTQMKAFIEQGGKIRASKLDNGEYVLRAHVPGLGGGPLFAVIATVGTLVVGGAVTVGAAIATTAVAGPVAGFAAGVACAEATKDAAILVAITTSAAPTP